MRSYDREIFQAQLDNEKAVLKQIEANYKDALEEINSKIAALMGRADADMQHVVYQVQFQQALKGQIQGILQVLQTNSFDTVSAYLAKCYEEGFLGTMYSLQSQGVPLAFPINQKQVAAAIQHETNLSTTLYKSFDMGDLQRKIAAEISRGFSTGATYAEIARNISASANVSKNKANRIARTEGHRIVETAAYHAQQQAKDRGADIVKIWDAALDAKTRPSHARVDGEIRELEEKYSNGLKYPGDPAGAASEVVNCRCRSRTDARWALEADATKMLGDTSKMTDAQKQAIADKLGIPVENLDQYSGQIVPINAKDYADFKNQYEQLWHYEGSALQQESEARIASYSGENTDSRQSGTQSAAVRSAESTSTENATAQSSRNSVAESKETLENNENSSTIKPDRVVSGHSPTPKTDEPGAVIDHQDSTGAVDCRSFYGESGFKEKDLHTDDHGNPKWHSLGQHGEHAHDYEWNDDGTLKNKTTREITDEERKRNGDIL